MPDVSGVTRGATAALLVLVVAAGCGGDGVPGPTTDPFSREALAADYGISALRALEGSSFESLDPGDVAGLVIDACALVDGGETPSSAAARVTADRGSADIALLAEVVEIGVGDVCSTAPPTALDLIVAYEASVAATMTAAGLEPPEDPAAALSAGPVVCDALDTGSSPEQAVLAAAGVLFGVTAGSMDGLSAAGVSADDGVLLGAVVGSASAILCGEHRVAMEGFLEELGR